MNLNIKLLILLLMSSCLNLYTDELDSGWIELDELLNIKIQTANRTVELIKDVPASVVILNKQDIERLGLKTFGEVLAYIPGMYVIDDYYWLGSISYGVRGFFSQGPSNNMIILVNGVNQMSDKYSDYPDILTNVNPEIIDRIEVVRGPNSVVYGPGAFFGAINIITNEIDEDEPQKSVSASYGTYNTQIFNSTYSAVENDLKFRLIASYSSTDGINNPFTDITTRFGLLEYVGLDSNSTIEGQRKDQRKYIGLSLSYKNLFGEFSFSDSQKGIFDGQPNLETGSLLHAKGLFTNIGYNFQYKNISSQLKLGYYSNSHVLDYEVFREHYYELDAQNTNSYDLELINNYKPNDNFNLLFGLFRRTVLDIHQFSDFHYYGLDYGAREIGLENHGSFSTHAIYSQLNYNFFNKLQIVLGGRINHLEDYDIYFSNGIVSEDPDDMRPVNEENRVVKYATYSPENNGITFLGRAAIIYDLGENQVLKFLWGQASKQPSFTENYRQMPEDRPFLNPAYINTFELNYTADISKKININFSLFLNDLDKLISTKNLFDSNTGLWEIFSLSSGEMQTQGAELIIQTHPIESMLFNFSTTYQRTKDLRIGYEDIDVAYSPELLIKSSLAFYFNKNLMSNLFFYYQSEMSTFWKVDTTPDEGFRIGNKIDGYFYLDLNLRYSDFIFDNLFLNLKVMNLLDQEIQYPTTLSNAWADKGTLGIGRSFIVTLGYNF